MAIAKLEALYNHLLRRDSSPALPDAAEAARLQNREQLYGLLCYVQHEIARNEQLFDMAVDETLIDNIIYTLKSLRAQQQFLVQNLRRLEGVDTAACAEPEAPAACNEQNTTIPREGFALG